jgi:multidrug resistance efflux pump
MSSTTTRARTPVASARARVLPARRCDLVIRPYGDDGTHVVKDPLAREYFSLGPQEAFLLIGLDGHARAEALAAAFERRFGEVLSAQDIDDFVEVARASGLIDDDERDYGDRVDNDGGIPTDAAQSQSAFPAAVAISAAHARERGPRNTADAAATIAGVDAAPPHESPPPALRAKSAKTAGKPRQSLLYWRRSLFDPDRLFDRLEPWLRFVWTRTFLLISATAIVVAAAVTWTNRHEIISAFTGWDWRVLTLVWLTLCLTTTLHEFAHGLTCKHYGGEVREVGFLLMFFIPCFYCNVSDAWLFRDRSKRLLVTFAGGYCDVCLWAIGVFVWRLTAQETLPNYLAWMVLSVCGARTFFNLNPLLKLDGYYLLSDAAGIPNLRERAFGALAGRVRWLLWGAARPAPEPRGGFLAAYGATAWLYSLAFLLLMFAALTRFAGTRWGAAGAVAAVVLGGMVTRPLFRNFSFGEAGVMVRTRRARTIAWLCAAAAVLAGAFLIPINDRVSGPFEVRSVGRREVRAPVAGFVRAIAVREGDGVRAGTMLAEIEVTGLPERLLQKRAELAEAESKLAFAAAGSRTPSQNSGRELHIVSAERELARATVTRVAAELAELEARERRQRICSQTDGLIVTPHLAEQVGRFLQEGELLCTIEAEPGRETEVALSEQDVARVSPGQPVEVKVRALPFGTVHGVVISVGAATATTIGAAAAGAAAPERPPGEPAHPANTGPSTITVYCRLSDVPPELRPGMTGDARITCGRRPVGEVYATRLMRYVRAEWW